MRYQAFRMPGKRRIIDAYCAEGHCVESLTEYDLSNAEQVRRVRAHTQKTGHHTIVTTEFSVHYRSPRFDK